MTEKSEYNYSLLNLQESLREVMEGEYTPQEIHGTIVNSVKKNMRYYKACYNDSVRLLALLRGNTNSSIKVHDNFEEIAPGIKIEKIDGIKTEYTANEYWNGDVPEHEFEQYLQKYGLNELQMCHSNKYLQKYNQTIYKMCHSNTYFTKI